MSRQARVVAEGVPHHATQRGNNRQDIFLTDDDRHFYIETLREKGEQFGLTSEKGRSPNRPRPSCFGGFLQDVGVGLLNPFEISVVDGAAMIESIWERQLYNGALNYAFNKNLLYPFKSSVFRGMMSASRAVAGKLTGPALMADVGIVGFTALVEEYKDAEAGRCQ